MAVRDYCRTDPHTARPDDSVRDAAKRMDSLDVGCLVVVDDEGRPVGMVTDRDVAIRVLRGRLDADATPLRDFMQAPVIQVTEKAPLAVAVRFMRRNAMRRIPVVDPETGRLTGLITGDDMLPLLARELTAAVGVVRAQAAEATPVVRGGR